MAKKAWAWVLKIIKTLLMARALEGDGLRLTGNKVFPPIVLQGGSGR